MIDQIHDCTNKTQSAREKIENPHPDLVSQKTLNSRKAKEPDNGGY